MGQELDLLRSLPKTKRDINARSAEKNPNVIANARQYGFDYFDGDRKYGYGGYRYDGRWRPVAADIFQHYQMHHGQRVLDVGCAKGFLVSDLCATGLDAYGLDVSRYAVVENPHSSVVGRLHHANAVDLPFPTATFDLVVSINTLHNLGRAGCIAALREIMRVSRGPAYVVVDSYRTDEERELFERWVLTAKTHGTPEFWLELFEEAGYTGDYAWTIVETTP